MGQRIGADLSSCSVTYSNYDNGIYQGQSSNWINCAGGESYTIIDVFSPFNMIIAVRTMDAADIEALDHILATFNVDTSKLPQ